VGRCAFFGNLIWPVFNAGRSQSLVASKDRASIDPRLATKRYETRAYFVAPSTGEVLRFAVAALAGNDKRNE